MLFRQARTNGDRVTDVSFQEAVKKRYREEAGQFDFLISGKAILVTALRPDADTPILLTVMTTDMIDGMVIRNLNTEELKTVFKRWRHESKQRENNEKAQDDY
jgi:hypothetical protein